MPPLHYALPSRPDSRLKCTRVQYWAFTKCGLSRARDTSWHARLARFASHSQGNTCPGSPLLSLPFPSFHEQGMRAGMLGLQAWQAMVQIPPVLAPPSLLFLHNIHTISNTTSCLCYHPSLPTVRLYVGILSRTIVFDQTYIREL